MQGHGGSAAGQEENVNHIYSVNHISDNNKHNIEHIREQLLSDSGQQHSRESPAGGGGGGDRVRGEERHPECGRHPAQRGGAGLQHEAV